MVETRTNRLDISSWRALAESGLQNTAIADYCFRGTPFSHFLCKCILQLKLDRPNSTITRKSRFVFWRYIAYPTRILHLTTRQSMYYACYGQMYVAVATRAKHNRKDRKGLIHVRGWFLMDMPGPISTVPHP